MFEPLFPHAMGILHGQTGVPYGRRLLPVLVDELDPERLFARVPRSTHLQDGFIDVTCQIFARAINRAASWLEDTFGKSLSFQTLAYFGPSDIRYCIFLLGASKVGYKASKLIILVVVCLTNNIHRSFSHPHVTALKASWLS